MRITQGAVLGFTIVFLYTFLLAIHRSNREWTSSPTSLPSPDLTSESNSKDRETALYESIQVLDTPSTLYTQNMAVLGSRSQTSGTQEILGQQRGSEAMAALSRQLEKSPSPPKRTYSALSDLTSETSSSPSALASRGQTVRDEVLPKQRRLMKQESV